MRKSIIIFLAALGIVFCSCSKRTVFKWTKNNLEKANHFGLDSSEVIILASLVEKQTQNKNDKGKVARVFINRLESDIPLQSFHSLVFGIGDTTLTLLTRRHIRHETPYNTYNKTGLPPGPICNPSMETIREVLNCKESDFLYFCSSPELDGSLSYFRTELEYSAIHIQVREALIKQGKDHNNE